MTASSSDANPPSRAARGASAPLIVQKYGGSSVAEPEQIRAVAKRVARLRSSGRAAIVVVSAMGKATDELVRLAYRVSPAPNRRELDMLLSSGERVSMALMSMALNDEGCAALSFTGSQAGVLTDSSHSNARIVDVRPTRIEAEIAAGRCAVIAGFQGVSPDSKEITTLGRGGSDVTAVALAARFRALRCEILKDVDGVYSADPRSVPTARRIPELSDAALLDMTFWGAKVLHYRSVELASCLGIPLYVGLAHPPQPGAEGESGTFIKASATGSANPGPAERTSSMFERSRVLSINSHHDVRWLSVNSADASEALGELEGSLAEEGLPWPQLLHGEPSADGWSFLIAAPQETLDAIARLAERKASMNCRSGPWSSVTATCQGAYASDLPKRIGEALRSAQASPQRLLFGAMSVTAIVDSGKRAAAEQALHSL